MLLNMITTAIKYYYDYLPHHLRGSNCPALLRISVSESNGDGVAKGCGQSHVEQIPPTTVQHLQTKNNRDMISITITIAIT